MFEMECQSVIMWRTGPPGTPVRLTDMEARELSQQLAIASHYGRAGKSYKRRVLAEFRRRGIRPW